MGGTIDTYFAPPLMVMLLADVDERGMQRIERAIHVLMTVNAAMGVFELLADHRFFPYRLDGTTFLYDTRSSALQGHPLVNACITSWYVLSMLCGSRSLSAGLKLPLVLLQFAGLVAFGGRVGLVSSLALTAWYVLGQVHRVMRSGRVPILGAAVALIMLAVLPVGLGVMAERGFFTAIAERFIDDGGSANARIEMFAMFDNLPLRDLLVGPDNALIDSNRRVNGLEMGIENPIVKTLLYHGILITLLMTVAMVAFLWDIARRCSRSVWLPTLSFVILVMTSESIAGKTTALSKYAILLLVLYRPARALWVQPAADPATDAAPDAAVDEVRLRRTPRSRTDPRRISLAAASTQEP
jgi:hypothetical protein